MKFYAVKKGHKIGVFDNWTECQEATKGFSGPEFKSFSTREEAEAYLEERDVWVDKVKNDCDNGFLVAFTDGSYDAKLKRYSYGVIFVKPDGTEDKICGYGNNEKYIDSNNIIGEIFGVVNALDWAISNDYEKIKIYHDYEGLSKWVSCEWSAKSEVAKMYKGLYESKFKDFLTIEFEKVPGHSNIIYNEKADQIAKSALTDFKKVAIQGDNWFSLPYISKNDFDAFVDLLKDSNDEITYIVNSNNIKDVYKFSLDNNSVTVTLHKTGKNNLLLQGKNNYLFQIITSLIVELFDVRVEKLLSDAYRMSIKDEDFSDTYKQISNELPSDYPIGLKRLIKQSIINLTRYVESEDYSMYAFPSIRALEGHIKYLITKSGGVAGRKFTQFNKQNNYYIFTAQLPDLSKKASIEKCYNYYMANRNTIFHFGDIIGTVDNTRFINNKDEADEIIKNCIELIKNEQ